MKELILKEELYHTIKETAGVFSAEYDGESCYCVVHHPTETKAVLDDDKVIVQSVIRKMKRTGIVCDIKRSGTGFLLKFRRRGREHSISLRTYLFAKYNGYSLEAVRHAKIGMIQTEDCEHGIIDLRKKNLFNAGGARADGIHVISRPSHPNEKYLVAEVGGKTEIISYSEPLCRMLTTKNMCSVIATRASRLQVVIHFAKRRDGYRIMNLSRFVEIYSQHYHRFAARRGADKIFLADVPRLSADHADEDCAHVNSQKWNCANENLLFMPKEHNEQMSRWILDFSGLYNAFAFHYDGAILIRIAAGERDFYYRCADGASYLNFQKVLLGKTQLLEKLRINYYGQNTITTVETPRQAAEKQKEKQEHPKNASEKTTAFWRWCSERDSIISLYTNAPHSFIEWSPIPDEGASPFVIIQNVLPLFLSAADCATDD